MKSFMIAACALSIAAFTPVIDCTQKKFPRTLAGRMRHGVEGVGLLGLSLLVGYSVLSLTNNWLRYSRKTTDTNTALLSLKSKLCGEFGDALIFSPAALYGAYKLSSAGAYKLKEAFSANKHEIVEDDEDEHHHSH